MTRSRAAKVVAVLLDVVVIVRLAAIAELVKVAVIVASGF